MTPNSSRFRKIVSADAVGLTSSGIAELQGLSEEPVVFHPNPPANDSEATRRISDADCVLVSWDTQIGAAVLRSTPRLAYVGMCCGQYDERSVQPMSTFELRESWDAPCVAYAIMATRAWSNSSLPN